ncbi:hypothetical protein D3C79_533280 [compost metagenome]
MPGQRLAGHLDELAAVVQAAEVVGGRGMAAAPVFVLEAVDQLLVDLLRLFQRAEGLLALAQQAQGPQQAGENHQGHAQVQPELPGIGQRRGREDFVLALADHHAETPLGQAPVQALVRVAGRVLGQHACFTAVVRQPGQQGVAGHDHAAAIDAQPLQAVILQQAHQPAAAQVDVL